MMKNSLNDTAAVLMLLEYALESSFPIYGKTKEDFIMAAYQILQGTYSKEGEALVAMIYSEVLLRDISNGI